MIMTVCMVWHKYMKDNVAYVVPVVKKSDLM